MTNVCPIKNSESLKVGDWVEIIGNCPSKGKRGKITSVDEFGWRTDIEDIWGTHVCGDKFDYLKKVNMPNIFEHIPPRPEMVTWTKFLQTGFKSLDEAKLFKKGTVISFFGDLKGNELLIEQLNPRYRSTIYYNNPPSEEEEVESIKDASEIIDNQLCFILVVKKYAYGRFYKPQFDNSDVVIQCFSTANNFYEFRVLKNKNKTPYEGYYKFKVCSTKKLEEIPTEPIQPEVYVNMSEEIDTLKLDIAKSNKKNETLESLIVLERNEAQRLEIQYQTLAAKIDSEIGLNNSLEYEKIKCDKLEPICLNNDLCSLAIEAIKLGIVVISSAVILSIIAYLIKSFPSIYQVWEMSR